MTARRRIIVLGAGGFAREVRWLIRDINHSGHDSWDFVGFAVSDLSKLGPHDSRDDVIGDVDWLLSHHDKFDALAIGIGTPGPRLKMAAQLISTFDENHWPTLIHPSVRFDEASCQFGHGALICAGTIGTVHVRFEPFCMVNLACTLGHEAVIGRGTCLNPSVNLSGGVLLGEGVLVGTGAQILQYLSVGDRATVGAGAVVTKDVPAGSTVVGIPAKPLRQD